MHKSSRSAAITTLSLLVGALTWAPLQAASHLLFKGLNVSDNCLEASVPAPPKAPVPARNLTLECASIPYADEDTLVYDIAAGSCATLEAFAAASVNYSGTVYVPNTSEDGSLESVSDSLFLADQQAFLQLDADRREVMQIGATVCAPTGPGPPPDPGELAQLDYLKAHNITAGDNFGDQVAVSGNTVVIAARLEDGSATMVNGPDDDLASNAGAAYVFVRDGDSANWIQQAYLKASDTEAGDNFGADVAIDGDTIVVGANLADEPSSSGTTYVFVRNGGTWTEQALLKASDSEDTNQFGRDVAISGNTIVVGTFVEEKAYVFERDPVTGDWEETAILTGSNTELGDSFGRDVTIDGDTIVVGAFAEDSDATGVNGPEDNNNALRSGAAYVFVRDGENWSQEAYIKASNTDPSDQFGGELSLSGDTLVVGVFHERSNATGINGDEDNNSAEDAGAAYVFVREAGVWSQQAYVKASNTDSFDTFGASVWISGDRLAVGAPREDSATAQDDDDDSLADSGAVYIYIRDGTTWSQTGYLKASNLDTGDWFSRDLGLSGPMLVSGAFREDSGIVNDESDESAADSGAGYVFNIPIDAGPGDDTEPPVVIAPPDIVGFEAVDVLTPVDLGTATVTDNSGEQLTATPDNPGPFPIGDTTVTWSATDSSGNTGTDQQLVNIVDTIDPVVTAPADISTPATGVLTSVALGTAGATDNGGPVASLVNDAPGNGFPVGETIVTWTATDASGNSGTDTQSVTITAPEILVPSSSREPTIDGDLSLGEWDDAITFDFQNGFAAFVHDDDRLYILIDMLGDDGNDPFSSGGGDQFWLHFDINEDGVITPDVDLRFRLESGTGNMRKQTYCDGCPFDFNPLESQTLSARGEGFGCYIDDGSVSFIPLQCDSHRVWELAIDLAEVGMRGDQTARFGMLVSSGTPLFTENIPSNLNDLSNYGLLMLEESPRQLGSGPGAMAPLFEVTQAIQTTDNALDLVAGNRTALRVWDENNEEEVKVFAYGSSNGIDLPGSPMLDIARLSDQDNGITRDSNRWNSFTVLPQGWSQAGDVDFNVLVQGLDDSVAASLGANISFVSTRTPVFWTVPIRNNFPNGTFAEVNAGFLGDQEVWLRLMAPIEELTIVRKPVLDVNNVTSSAALKEVLKNYDSLTALAWVLGLVNTGSPPFALPEQITGFFEDAGGSSDPVWISSGKGRISWVGESANNSSLTYAHEINHNLDRDPDGTWGRHVDGVDPCEAPGPDDSWPYGISYTIQEVGVAPSPISDRMQSIAASTPDIMSYCIAGGFGVNRWWSPYRWAAWVGEFRTMPPVTEGGVHGPNPTPEDSFYIQGRVYPDMSGEFTQVLRQPGVPDAPDPGNPYTVRILDCGASVLEETSFDAVFEDVEGQPVDFVSFTMTSPAPAASCSIELALDDVVLDTITISANAPIVEVLSPNGGEFWAGTELIEWSASDADANPLKFTILLSADDGMAWQPVASMIEDTEYEIDSAQWPGTGEAVVRVIASDGANTTFDDSDATFFVVGKHPEVEIRFPADGSTVSSIHELTLSGLARLPTGELAPPENLVWSVDGMPFGLGREAPIFFTEGAHEITLELLDGDSVLASSTIEVVAGDAPGVFGFANAEFTTSEVDGQVNLTVVREGGASGPASVLFHTADGTAVSGGDPTQGEDDYVSVPELTENRLEWADGDSSQQSIMIQINPDAVVENEESFEVILTALDEEQLGVASATVVIQAESTVPIISDGFESTP